MRWYCCTADEGYDTLDDAIEAGLRTWEADSAEDAAEKCAEDWWRDDGCDDGEHVDVWVRAADGRQIGGTFRVYAALHWHYTATRLTEGES